MKPRDKRDKDRGAALITVLTMVAIMATLAVVATEASRMSVRRTLNQVGTDQAHWYLIGAEALAMRRLDAMLRLPIEQRPDQSEWQARAFTFALDDGALHVSLRDGSNCFNLNSIVDQAESGDAIASGRGMVQFARLLDLLNVRSDGGSLAANLADWVDADSVTSAGGPEDAAYTGQPRRPANTLISDIGELRDVRGFNDQIVRDISRVACVRPTAAPNLINPNTLLVADAPVLASAIADLSLDSARRIIRERPRGGWPTLDAFFAHPVLAQIGVTEAMHTQFSLESVYYVQVAHVERDAGSASSAALLRRRPSGFAVERRVFGISDEDYRL